MSPSRIIRAAAWTFASFHLVFALFVIASVGALSRLGLAPLAETLPALWFAIPVMLGLGIARGLEKRRAWGLYWFCRFPSIELSLMWCIAEMVNAASRRDALAVDARAALEPLFLAGFAAAVGFYVAKVLLRRRLLRPEVRGLFPGSSARWLDF